MHFYGQKARFFVCLEDQLFSHVVIPSLLHHFIRLPGSAGVHNVLQHENLGLNQRHFASSSKHTAIHREAEVRLFEIACKGDKESRLA
jgi:hypothetical protein